ncbi:AAA family ATPase [Enterococcus faecium]|uniref:AAA family ATPase n=1 Tax=Enterococcus faecium TaxID=1352 RepID=UPI003CE5B9B6
MKLVQLIVKNFRGYSKETKLNVDELTALIGKNDAGKSTLLEAMEIFFNNKKIACEKEDLSIECDEKKDNIEISCLFSHYPTKLTIDSGSETTLKKEYLLNKDGLLHIKKIFNCKNAKPKEEIYIVCNHPTKSGYDNLLLLKQTDLRKKIQALNISEEKYDARNNASMRKAIWQSCTNLELEETELIANKEDSKKIYEALETYLPTFALFQSDRKSSDSDNEITDPMKIAISKALMGLEKEINIIKKEVQEKAIESAKITLEKLKEMDPTLSDSLIPEFKSEPKFDSLFKLTIRSDMGISINKRGSGVRRLILLNFFRAEAERKLTENDRKNNIIYAFEEPETSQHPTHQRMLLESFIELSKKENCQILITTHTPALGELLPLKSLRLITKNDQNISVIEQENEDIYKKVAKTLGVLSESIPKNAKGVLLVEGKADIVFFEHLTTVLKKHGLIEKNFEELGIVIMPVGGCNNLKDWVTRKLIEQIGLKYAVFLDSDRKNENECTKNVKTVSDLNNSNILAFTTKKREIENYLHPSLFNNEIVISDFNDVKHEAKTYYDKIGRKVLEHCWPKMSFEQIRDREKYVNELGDIKYELTEIVSEIINYFT